MDREIYAPNGDLDLPHRHTMRSAIVLPVQMPEASSWIADQHRSDDTPKGVESRQRNSDVASAAKIDNMPEDSQVLVENG